VVNFIMKRDYQGADTLLRVGGTTHSDAHEYEIAQTIGKSWDSGNVFD